MQHRWGSAAWRADAEHWADDQLAALGEKATGGMTDLSVQAWSAVWRLETSQGSVVLKQTTPPHRPEITVHAFCARVAPDHVDHPLALDAEGCRILLPDGGPTLLDTRSESVEVATELIMDYAAFQQTTIDQHADAIAAGLPTWLPIEAATELEQQIEALRSLPRSDLRHITAEQGDHLLSRLPAFRRAGETLAKSAIPHCLDHGDLWIGNVLPPRKGRPYRLIDFGDSAWTHPFLCLQPFLHYYRQRSIPAESSVINNYLAAWADFADPRELSTVLDAATLIAPLRRSRAGIVNFHHVAPEDAADLGPTPWQWLSC